jgi:hypothetical protein
MSTFAAYGRPGSAQPSCIPDWIANEANPVRRGVFLRWLFGRLLLADPAATTPAGNLRHGVLEQFTGEPRPVSRGGKRHKQASLSEELLRNLNEVQQQIEVLTGLGHGAHSRAGDVGHLYVLMFSTGVVKVGKAVDLNSRIATHKYHAKIHGVTIADASGSDAHPQHSKTERQLIDFCLREGVRIDAGTEYFTGVEFETVCDFADQVVGERLQKFGVTP